jgi:acyl transferase domain-containing protein/acyl carrier protein
MAALDTLAAETELARIWAEVLAVPIGDIRADRNFFALGGDSILLMEVIERVNSAFFPLSPDEGLPIMDFLQHGTVAALARRLCPDAPAAALERRAADHDSGGAVAIIGMAGRFPGASSIGEFWQNIRAGAESLRFFSAAELAEAGVSAADLADPRYVKCSGLLADVQYFDAEHFGLTPGEAALLAPETRLLIECSHEALEQAGYGVRWRGERVGVFVGAGLSTYLIDHFAPTSRNLESAAGMRLLLANSNPAARVSFLLNLNGPSVTLDTACSASLVATHQACRALLSGECEMAVAGGATVRRFAPRGYRAEEGGIFSPDGHCRPFSQRAAGTVGSSGAGVVLLKPLQAALRDSDSIWAVIKGSAVNNDGDAKVGYTAPSLSGQVEVIRAAQAAAQVEPGTIQLLETHGTATRIGDLIEIAALKQVFASHSRRGSCALGTLKANVGHLEAAAGVSGLIKVALALKYRQIPPVIHAEDPDPALELDASPFYLNGRLEHWPASSVPRRGGVSSFGMGGTNAHAVLEEAPQTTPGMSPRGAHLLILSARSREALQRSARELARQLETEPDIDMADVAYTLQMGRAAHEVRGCWVCASSADAAQQLQQEGGGTATYGLATASPGLVFMFPGQGSQHPDMLRGVYGSEPVFREQIDQCARLLEPHLGADLRSVLYPSGEHAGAVGPGLLTETQWCQPALFVVEYALARLWQSWGVKPTLMIGHSLGEYVAACLAGVWSLEDALRVVCVRGRLMQQAPCGRMLAVRLARDEFVTLLGTGCALAAVNGENDCVASGLTQDIDRLKRELARRGVRHSELDTSHAFHSQLMDAVASEFEAFLRGVEAREVAIPFVSNVTGALFEKGVCIPGGYWARHLRQTVEFAAGIGKLLQGAAKVFLEAGPATVLSSIVRHNAGERRATIISSASHPAAREPDDVALMRALGRLWQAGAPIDWPARNASSRAHRIALPTYAFERRRHWIEPRYALQCVPPALPGVSRDVRGWLYFPRWKRDESRSRVPAEQLNCCVLLDDGTLLGEQLAQALRRRYRHVVRARIGAAFCRTADGYCVDPMKAADYAALLADLEERGHRPDSIIHGWCIGGLLREAGGHECGATLGFSSLLALCQAVEQRGSTRRVRVTVLTNRAHVVRDCERGKPQDALLSTVVRVIARECPHIDCHSVDLAISHGDFLQQDGWMETLSMQLTESSSEQVRAWRDDGCWVLGCERFDAQAPAPPVSMLRHEGTYLVTGGLGGLGVTLAELLARSVRARLVLLCRSGFPERTEWDAVIAAAPDSEVSSRIRRIRRMEQQGAQVLLVRADVTQADQVRAAVAESLSRFGTLHGVIHAAGVRGGGVVALREPAQALAVMGPKVAGTLNVFAAVNMLRLDFFVMCSSLASIIAPAGQADYCAANAFQDAFAHAHDQASYTRFISINWDGWKDVGMAADAVRAGTLSEGALEAGISPEEGARVFELVLKHPRAQWIVSTRELRGLSRSGSPAVRPAASSAEAGSQEGHLPRTQAEKVLEQIWCGLLGTQAAGVHDDFFAIGGDSLLAIQLSAQIEARFAKAVPMRQLLRTPTIAGLAALVGEAAAGEK